MPPLRTWNNMSSAIAMTGTAYSIALRRRPTYQCPSPGHKNESAVAIPGDGRGGSDSGMEMLKAREV
jgi:hypothetical protein